MRGAWRTVALVLGLVTSAAVAAPPRQCAGQSLAAGSAAAAAAATGPSALWRSKRDGDFLIESKYDLVSGEGELRRRDFRIGLDGKMTMSVQPAWEAGDQLGGDPAARPPVTPRHTPAQRQIFTLVQQADRTATIPFEWDHLPAFLRSLLDQDDGLGAGRVAWLRGENGGTFRARASLLGAIVHSTPLVTGPPSPGHAGADYAAFHALRKDRATVVYVGASDGMLHAFSARDGGELFAYIPQALHAQLASLSNPRHGYRPYVDGSPVQGEARVRGQWKSVLASGMGMGARGVFALDITEPAAFGKGAGALWEFTEHDDATMGFVRAPPLIARLRTGEVNNTVQYRDFVLVASGSNKLMANSSGALFLLALDKPAQERWRRGIDYFKLLAPSPDASQAVVLSAPGLAIGVDGSAQYAYAGDLQGNLWRFDLSGKPPWENGKILFTARDASGTRQPIEHAPRIVFAPGGGYLVLFGTGSANDNADARPAPAHQSFYAIHDILASPMATVDSRERLAARTVAGREVLTVSGARLDFGFAGAKRGWYMDFGRDGESAGPPTLAAGSVMFNTFIPGPDGCGALPGRSYALDAVSGLAFDAAGVATAGAVTGQRRSGHAMMPPLLLETGPVAGASTPTGGILVRRSFMLVDQGANGDPGTGQGFQVTVKAGRLGWREIGNWQDLHEAAKR